MDKCKIENKSNFEKELYFVIDKYRSYIVDSDLVRIVEQYKKDKKREHDGYPCSYKVFENFDAAKDYLHKLFFDDSDYGVFKYNGLTLESV